jgi:hypothetical protein
MNRREAVEAINNCQRVYLFAKPGDQDDFIYGGNHPEWLDIFEDRHGFYNVEESFLLKPLRRNPDLWTGKAERYGRDCDFSARPLDQLVNDICNLYAGNYDDSISPSHVMMLLIRLTQAGFFVRHEKTVIIGSLRMNFAANEFWILRIGDFYVANDADRLSGFGSSPSIVCSRSINTVIKSLKAYYDRPRRIEL